MSKKLQKLKVPIPLDYARELGYDPSNLCHINAGRRRIFTIPKRGVERIIILLEAAKEDGRLQDLKILDLLPELRELLPYLKG